jgi:murein DD-endopeptidase / murein LD-carboxypeptidase
MKRTKSQIIVLFIIATTFLSLSLIKTKDPIDTLLNQTKDPQLKEKMVYFKKGGYEKVVKFEKYDVEAVIKSAKTFIGTPHQMGGLTKKGMDCSGLVMVAHQQNNVNIPRDGNEQARFGKIILNKPDLKRGNLVFFHSTYNTSKLVTHSGIYLGNEKFIHVSSKKGVSIASINSKYWASHYLFGTSLKK